MSTHLWGGVSKALFGLVLMWSTVAVNAAIDTSIGIVLMHGKGGMPTGLVAGLAKGLRRHGFLVENIEMPWSAARDYDVNVIDAEAQVVTALDSLRKQGAKAVFVAGHSQGGVFALHFAGQQVVDGVICIAPGGSVAAKVFRQELGDSVALARQMIEDGRGSEKTSFYDYEGKRGKYPVVSTPAVYLTWFDPDGAMNLERAATALKAEPPVLWLVAKRDYPGLRAMNLPLFKSFPKNPNTRLVEPDADHRGAPTASLDEIVQWIGVVTGTAKTPQ